MQPTFKPGEFTPMIKERDPLLVEREKTHGDFTNTAATAQMLKRCMSYDSLPDRQREAIDMICTKLSRIINGDAKHKDTWLDIAGYAKLGAEACDER